MEDNSGLACPDFLQFKGQGVVRSPVFLRCLLKASTWTRRVQLWDLDPFKGSPGMKMAALFLQLRPGAHELN